MPVIPLTDLTVRSLKPGLYLDNKTRSFGIRIGKHKKTWLVIRPNRTKAKFGSYPDISLADARAEAKRLLSNAPEAKLSAKMFKGARLTFLDENYRGRKERTKHEAKRLLEKHFPKLETKMLPEINDADIKGALDKIAGTPSEQLHAYRVVRCFFRWCTRPPHRYLRYTPMEGYQPPGKDRKGTRVLTDDELAAVWKAAKTPSLRIFRILILWGTRSTETASMTRNWVLDSVLTIPGENTKNGRPHAIPILPMAKAVLDDTEGEQYFSGRWGGHLTCGAWNKFKQEIQELSNTSGWQVRDIRRTFRSNMARFKVPRDVCEALINHAPAVLDEIYDRYDRLEEKRDALAKYEAHLQKLLEN